jgi:hypothetical protein
VEQDWPVAGAFEGKSRIEPAVNRVFRWILRLIASSYVPYNLWSYSDVH